METSVYSQNYSSENELNISPQFNLSMNTTGVKVVVTDMTAVGRTDTKTIKAIIGFDFVLNYTVGSHRYANGLDGYPGVYSLFSLRDMRAYPVDDVVGTVNEAAIDIKFYMMGSASGATPRVYAMDGGASGTKNNEFRGTKGSVADFTTMNATRFLKLTDGYDFDNVTIADIGQIIGSQITSNAINPAAAGDVIAFKTGSTSSVGGNKVGIMKIHRIEFTSTSAKDQGIYVISVKFPK